MQIMLPLTVKIIIDKRSKDAPFVAYTPELDVASCGPSEHKARVNLHEAVEIMLEEINKRRPSCISKRGIVKAGYYSKI